MPGRPPAQHRAAQRHRRLAVWCSVLLAPAGVLAAVYLSGSAGFPGAGRTQAVRAPAAAPAPSPAASAASAVGPPTASRPAVPPHRVRHHRRPAPPPATAAPSPSAPATPPPSQQSATASQVLALINQARAQAGLPPYTLSAGLDSSAAAHNARMAAGCGLSHQCPGEPPLGTRETDAGVIWTAAGENIGEGGPVPGTSSAVAQMAADLTQDMLNEKPPDDGHRLNILSSTFHHIGIAVSVDSSGTVWMTQDFSN
jgi:uncharacterized protein YkwD